MNTQLDLKLSTKKFYKRKIKIISTKKNIVKIIPKEFYRPIFSAF